MNEFVRTKLIPRTKHDNTRQSKPYLYDFEKKKKDRTQKRRNQEKHKWWKEKKNTKKKGQKQNKPQNKDRSNKVHKEMGRPKGCPT